MQLHFFLRLLKDAFRDLVPIILVILFFQLAIIQAVPEGWVTTAIGLMIVGVGLAVFLMGLEMGIFPVGEKLAKDFASHKIKYLVLFFGFMLGFGTVIAEPALAVIADKAAAVSSGRIDAQLLRYIVALSVGVAIVIGVFRIIKGHPIHYYIITGYLLVVGTTFFAPKEIVGLAYDLGGVTTSTVTVPLVAALGIGLATMIKGRNPVMDGFGLIAFAALTPMIFVQIYGIIVYNFVEAKEVGEIAIEAAVSEVAQISVLGIAQGLLDVLKDVIPILAIIFFFQYIVLKKRIEDLKNVIIGFGLVVVGLYAFILGLEMGLFSLGETMAYQLTQQSSVAMIYSFAFAIGFSTTLAEPALTAVAKKSKEISDGRVNDFVLRMFVASGVAVGIAIGSFRIVNGGDLHYYIMVGYMLVIALTFIAPKYIIPIAYDSGAVTTSTVTVPLVAALGIGLATNIPGRDPLIDGFGLIAFASLFPIITVMLYGIAVQRMGVKSDTEIEARFDLEAALAKAQDMRLSTVSVGKTDVIQNLALPFSALMAVVPQEKKDEALFAAKEAGASGVTMFKAEGMGLGEMDHMYRTPHEMEDLVMLFIVPTSIVDNVMKSITHHLHITSSGDGIAFAYPLSHMKGISLSEELLNSQIKSKP